MKPPPFAYLRPGSVAVRAPTAVRVTCVDTRTRTVLVEVSAWELDEPVTVLLDQVVNDTGLPVDKLTGRWLAADANCQASPPMPRC